MSGIRQNIDVLIKTILAGKDDPGDQVVAIMKSMFAFRIKARPHSLNDPIIELFLALNKGMTNVAVKLGPEHLPSLQHPDACYEHGGRWVLYWYTDGKLSMKSQEKYELPKVIGDFCQMWDTNFNHEIFDGIRVAEDRLATNFTETGQHG